MKYRIIFSLIFLFMLSLLLSCSNNTVTGPSGPPSDLTRSGKFITFTSNMRGDYDIYLAQVDPTTGILLSSGYIYSTNPFDLTAGVNFRTDKQSNWSPDGRVLVYSSSVMFGGEQIFAFFFKSDGSLDTTITGSNFPKNLFSSSGNLDENPNFSPDGLHLIFDRRNLSDSTRDIWIGDITGSGSTFAVGNIRMVTTHDGKDKYNPKWSPRISVRRVAYELASSTTAFDHDIYIIDPLAPSTNINYYNPGRSGYPAWEPACNEIIFESDQGNGGFYKIVSLGYPSNNGTPGDIAVSSSQDYRYPTWLPNGNKLAYIQINATTLKGNIYTISSSGGSSSKLLPSAFDNSDNTFPAW